MGIQKWTFSVMGPVLWNGIPGSHLDDIQKAITELFPRHCIYTAGWDFWLDDAFWPLVIYLCLLSFFYLSIVSKGVGN